MKISVIAKITCASAKFVKNWDSVFTESDAQKVCFLNDLFNPAKKFIVGKLLIIDFTATLTIQDDVAPAEAKMLKIDKTLGNMLWESEGDKDVSIVIDNENEIKAHKRVLKYRSSKFAKLLNVKPEPSDASRASTTSKIVVQNATFNTVKEAIMHCYDIQNSDALSAEDAADILAFAAEYEIEDLKEDMEEFCIKNLSVSNACLFSNFSITAKSEKLKNACLGFLANCMASHTAVKDIDKLNAEMEKSLFLESFSTVVDD